MVKDLILFPLPDVVDTHPTMYFPLALTYLGAAAKNAGYDVQIMDCRERIVDLPESRFYGFSCVTSQVNAAKDLARKLKGKGITIIGGAHPSFMPLDCVKDFDYVVRGEGENVLLDIMGGKVQPGIVEAKRIFNLDSIPYPAWDMVEQPFSDVLFPGERYGNGELAATLIGSRGCPHACSFCANLHVAPVAYRSVGNIIGELKELMIRGVRHFRFEDDCFTILPQFATLCNEIAKLNIRYKCHTRSDLMTTEKAKLMFDSGCEECGLGVESADPEVLRINNKKEDVDDHKRAVAIIKASGMRAKVYWVMGLPGETEATLELNKQFVLDTQPDKWTVSTFSPYPGSAVFKSPGKYGIEIINKDFSKWWNFCEAYNHVIYGQTRTQMWDRYRIFYEWLKTGAWKHGKTA